MGRIELPTPSLPRKCSTAELHRLMVLFWAEDGARTRYLKLGRLSLCQMSYFRLLYLWGRVDSNHRTHPRTDLQSVAIATMRLPRFVQLRAGRRTRTADRLITNQLLYQLSYTGILSKNSSLPFRSTPSLSKGCAKVHVFLILTIFFIYFFSKKINKKCMSLYINYLII